VTDAELDRLADLIARALLAREPAARDGASRTPWLPSPVRPVPPERGSAPPPWSGAAQDLNDVAPSSADTPPRFRPSGAELARVARAAAAGKAPPRDSRAREAEPRLTRPRAAGAPAIDVTIGVSNRHVHLSAEHIAVLFGGTPLTVARPLTQPTQFAAGETVSAVGPKGQIEGVRVVGPARSQTQLEIAASDAALIGIDAPVAASGALEQSVGGVTLVGPVGRVELQRGVMIAARHLHLSATDSRRWGLRDGDRLDVRCGDGARAATFHDVLVRSGNGHATELHLDGDEARAVGVRTGDLASIVAWRSSSTARRPLVTERDILEIARKGGRVPTNAILTPSARDRARSLGLLDL
jgi:putative phosphotransacetylase